MNTLRMLNMFVAGGSFVITIIAIYRGNAGIAVFNAGACALNLWVALS